MAINTLDRNKGRIPIRGSEDEKMMGRKAGMKVLTYD